MAKGGLGKWFKEEWTDVKTGKPCGRSGKDKKTRSYPACRPKAAAAKMTKQEKKSISKRKQDQLERNGRCLLQVNEKNETTHLKNRIH